MVGKEGEDCDHAFSHSAGLRFFARVVTYEFEGTESDI